MGERLSRGRVICQRYEILRRVGYGSVGEVYETLDLELDKQPIALKVLHPHLCSDKATLQRFQNEVYISRQLSHPNIARVYDFGEEAELKFLTLEYISGCNLHELAQSYPGNTIPQDEVVYLLRQIATAFAYAHKLDIVHRDLKPENILIEKSGICKLSDFGLAYSVETNNGLTRTGELVGTPCYLAPECFLTPVASKTVDVYAFGILMFELLSGSLPFESPSYHELGKLHRDAELPVERLTKAQVPKALIALIVKCTAKNAEARPRDGQNLEQELDALQSKVNLGKSQVLLQTMVNRKRRDSFYTDEKVRSLGRLIALLVLVLFPVLMSMDMGQRERVATDLSRIEAHTGIPTAGVRELLGFGAYDLKSVHDLLNIKQVKQDWHTKVFLAGGLDLNTRVDDSSLDTALHAVVHETNYRTSVLIDEAKVSDVINVRNRAGDTPLMRAVKRGNNQNVALRLLPRVSILSKKLKRPKVPNGGRFVQIHRNSKAYLGNQALVSPGADKGIPDNTGNLPLHIAIAAGDVALTNLLLSMGETSSANIPTTRNQDGFTPLHLAVLLSNHAITEMLLEFQFPLETRDGKGRTPLMIAISQDASSQSEKIVSLLLRRGASVTARDDQGLLVYDHAREFQRVDELPAQDMTRVQLSSELNENGG